jgi:CelD/BcsL family acetyltransferase involved in cellulose biosynthesis
MTLAELEDRHAEWRGLAATSTFSTIFTDPRWLLAWWRHYGEGHEPWSFALEDDAGSLRGLALLALRRSAASRELAFAGGRWNGFDTAISAAGAEDELAAALLTALRERRNEWDVLRIGRLPTACSLAGALLGGRASMAAMAHDVRLQPYVELPPQIDAFESRFTGKRRTDFRRKWRRLQEAGAQMQLVTDPAQTPQAVARLLELRHARAAEMGQDHRDMDARFERFLSDVVVALLPDDVRLWTLELDGSLLTAKLDLLQGRRQHGYIAAVSSEQRSLSPGHSLERQAIHAMIEEGRSEFELGPGRDDYKYEWGASDRPVARIVVASPTARGRLLGARAAFDLRLRNTAAAEALRRRKGILPERATAESPARMGPRLPDVQEASDTEREGAQKQ